jgi:hypothetical protein
MTRYDTTGLFTNTGSYTTVDFTKTFNSSVTGIYQTLSTGTQLIVLPKGTPGNLYTYQLNANVQSQWYYVDYSSYGPLITNGVVIGNVVYFISGDIGILKYYNNNFTFFKIPSSAPGTLVMVGSSGRAYSIDNGLTWTLQSASSWDSVVFGNGTFVASAYNNQAYSADGVTWTNVASPVVGGTLAYGNSTFVMVGSVYQAYSTDNGRTWTPVASPITFSPRRVTYGNGTFVMVSQNSQAYSADYGRSWTVVTSPLSGNWWGVTFGNNKFVMIGAYTQPNSTQAYSIDNGRTWTLATTTIIGYWWDVTFGNNKFVMVGDKQAYSTDGIVWTVCSPLLSATYYGVTYDSGSGNFYMVSSSKQAYSVNNGITWTALASFSGTWDKVSIGLSTYPISGSFTNISAVGNYIYASTSNVAVQIDTTQNLSTSAAYKYPAPLPVGQYVFANGPRYVYMFSQDSTQTTSPTNIVRYDPYPPTTTLQASILVDYKSSKTKPTSASMHIVQSQKVTTMDNLDIRCPVKELWLMGATNGYQYSNLASQCSLLINNEPLLTLDVGSQKYLKTIQPFETHTSMPVRNFSVLSFELNPESPKPNGTINFSRINEQQFTGGATHAWASTYNIFVIKDGVGGLMFNF